MKNLLRFFYLFYFATESVITPGIDVTASTFISKDCLVLWKRFKKNEMNAMENESILRFLHSKKNKNPEQKSVDRRKWKKKNNDCFINTFDYYILNFIWDTKYTTKIKILEIATQLLKMKMKKARRFSPPRGGREGWSNN